MCSVSTNGERASPAQQGFQLIGSHFSYTLDKHTNIQAKYLPEYKNWFISVFINDTYIGWLLAHWLLDDRYPHIYTHVHSYMHLPLLTLYCLKNQ